MTRDDILALCEDASPEATQRALAWQIEDRDTLEWALGILAEAEAEAASIKRSAEAARAQVAAREAELLRRVKKSSAFLESAVEDYAKRNRKTLIPGKRKTASFIHGDISYRSAPERLVVEDEAAALAWCRSQPVDADLVRTTYEINKKSLDAYYAATKVIPPGCAVPPASESITIRACAPDAIDATPNQKELK